MPPRPKPEPLSGEAVITRTPRVLRYLASVVDAVGQGDFDYTLEAPSDLPLDEAAFVTLIYSAADLADAAGVTGDMLREQAAKIEANMPAKDGE